MRAAFEMFLVSFPDMRMEVDDMVGEDDKVVIRGRMSGTHQGEFMGIPATNKSFEISFIDIFDFNDAVTTEKVTEFKGGKKKVVERKLYPGSSASSQPRTISAVQRTSSMSAKLFPMHTRGPSPNGMYVKRCLRPSGRCHRCGSNRSGFAW